MTRFRSSGSPSGSAKRSSARGTSGGMSEVSASCTRAERLVEAQQHFGAKAQMQACARLAGELRDALDADFMQG